MKSALLLLLIALPAIGANWVVSPSGSGNGTTNSPGSLVTATAHTGWAASIAAGDTVYLRAGTYTQGTNIMDMQFSGSAGNLVTWRNYPNERAIINHKIYFQTRDYHRFIGLEFYDSNKQSRPIAIGYFDSTGGGNNEWINCIIHDTPGVWTGYSAGAVVRGCIVWFAGKSSLDHVVYPHVLDFSGNIVGWTSSASIEQGVPGTKIRNNVFFGTGITINLQGVAMLMTAGSSAAGQFVGNNVVFESKYASQGLTLQNTSAGANAVTNNIVVAHDPMRLMNAYSAMVLTGNTIFDNQNSSSYVLQRADSSGSWTVNGNNYYTTSTFTTPFLDQSVAKTFATWKSDNPGFDTTSTSTIAGGNPPDSVTVFPNADEPKRAHIAIFNWSGAHNVAVNVSGVLGYGDSYCLYSAQNYLAGPIRTGQITGPTISVPMTNLSVATVLYFPTNSQPTATSPQFGAFVLTGARRTLNATRVIVGQ